jgi:hypothetical protein
LVTRLACMFFIVASALSPLCSGARAEGSQSSASSASAPRRCRDQEIRIAVSAGDLICRCPERPLSTFTPTEGGESSCNAQKCRIEAVCPKDRLANLCLIDMCRLAEAQLVGETVQGCSPGCSDCGISPPKNQRPGIEIRAGAPADPVTCIAVRRQVCRTGPCPNGSKREVALEGTQRMSR